MKSRYDVVILGAGHNGLVAAAYLARAGLSVLLLEKNDYIGGATTSQKVFPDYDAHLSRYSYLVSLFPEKIIRDLGLKLELRRRATGSFTPYVKDGRHDGLLLSNVSEEASRESMRAIDRRVMRSSIRCSVSTDCPGSSRKKSGTRCWSRWLAKEEFRRRFDRRRSAVARPGAVWRKSRSVVRSNAICKTIWSAVSFSRTRRSASSRIRTIRRCLQNRCFLYHLIGNKTGEWKVPVGGMGAVARELEQAARQSGAEMLTRVQLRALDLNGKKPQRWNLRSMENDRPSRRDFFSLTSVATFWRSFSAQPYQPDATDEGSVFKINMLLRRLPKLKATRYAGDRGVLRHVSHRRRL